MAFKKAAVRFGVAESDYLLLGSMGIATFEQLAYRITKADDLEGFLRGSVLPRAAFLEDDGEVVVFRKSPAELWEEFRLSEDAAAVRKLWAMAREVAKSEIEKPKAKVDLSSAVAMEKSAVGNGMPAPASDTERPSLFTLTKVSKVLVPPGASYEHLAWENYISMEDEGILARSGKLPKGKPEITVKDDQLKVKDSETLPPPGEKVADLEMMRKSLDLRGRSFAMVGVAGFETYRALTDKYVGKMRAVVPVGMRNPTLSEVRRFDRALHEEILKWLSRSVGSLDTAIRYHLDDDTIALWRLLDPVLSRCPTRVWSAPRLRSPRGKTEEGPSGKPITMRRKPRTLAIRRKP